MITKRIRFCAAFMAATLLLGLTSCSGKPVVLDDILSQKPISANKIPITVLVKSAFSIASFEKEIEKKFPQVDIIQVGNYSANMGIAEYEARMKNDDLTDLVMTWPLEVGKEYQKDCLMDLSTLPCTSKYTTAMLNNISQNGKLFYLPGPTQIRGIVYNKTLFEENGWKVPTDFNGFIALCKLIEESGIRSLQLGLDNAEVLDTAFVGYGYDSSFSKPENAHKMLDYNNGIGSFADNFMPALKSFQTLIDSGVLQKADLNIDYADRERLLFSRQCAMVEDSVMFTHMGFDYNGCKDEFALMPFFNPGEDGRDWARLYPVCYIGASKKLTLPENKKKYDLVMDLLEYISTPEGQLTLIGNNGGMFSSLKDMPAPDIPEIKDLLPALEHGRYAIFPTLKNAQTALRNGLEGMVNGTLTASDVVKMVDQQNQNPAIPASTLILGSATDDFSLIETGNFLTDAMRKQSKSDVALFLDNGKDGTYNGKGINGRLYKGDLTPTDITRILPDLRYNEKGELWKITMTGENLINTLEYSIPVDNNHIGWFYYFSGLKMEFAPAATPGKRIRKITDDKDQPIDPKRLYSIAVMDETVPHEFIQSCLKTGVLISTVFEQAIESNISPSKDHRLIICNP